MYNGINISSSAHLIDSRLWIFTQMHIYCAISTCRRRNMKGHDVIMSLDLGLVADDGRAYNKSFRHRFIQTSNAQQRNSLNRRGDLVIFIGLFGCYGLPAITANFVILISSESRKSVQKFSLD